MGIIGTIGEGLKSFIPNFMKNYTPGEHFVKQFEFENGKIKHLNFKEGNFKQVIANCSLESIDKAMFVYVHV